MSNAEPAVGTTNPVNPVVQPINATIGAGYGGYIAAPQPPADIGGTGAGGNSLSMNLGGLNLNYDLGPSVSTVAKQAYSFVGSSFNTDAALLSNTISDTQNFVGGFLNPILSGVPQQEAVNAQVLPQLYNNLLTANYNIGMGSIQADTANAQASIASSNASAAASNSSGCFITTAVCESLGLPDDCTELRMLREFRDTYMRENADRRALVMEYYATAPAYVAAINARKDSREIYARMRRLFIEPAVRAIVDSRPKQALTYYKALVSYARLVATERMAA